MTTLAFIEAQWDQSKWIAWPWNTQHFPDGSISTLSWVSPSCSVFHLASDLMRTVSDTLCQPTLTADLQPVWCLFKPQCDKIRSLLTSPSLLTIIRGMQQYLPISFSKKWLQEAESEIVTHAQRFLHQFLFKWANNENCSLCTET